MGILLWGINLLTRGFYLQGTGLAWLFPLVNGAPPIGWHDALAYLVLPVLLVASQFVSQRIMSPPSDDPQQAQTQAILKFLPLMIGAQYSLEMATSKNRSVLLRKENTSYGVWGSRWAPLQDSASALQARLDRCGLVWVHGSPSFPRAGKYANLAIMSFGLLMDRLPVSLGIL